MRCGSALLFCCVLASSASASAQTQLQASSQTNAQIGTILSELNRAHSFSSPSLSPDGRWAIWTEHVPAGAAGRASVQTILCELPTRHMSPLSGPDSAEIVADSLRWSNDGSQFAFLSDAGPDKQRQLFIMKPGESAPRQLTHVKGYLTDIRWAPGDAHLAFLFAENGGGGGPLEALAAPVGDIGADIHNQQITLIDAAGGTPAAVTDKNLNIYEYDWAPDGKHFAAIAAKGPADNNWWIAKLYTVDAVAGSMTLLYTPPPTRQIAIPRWSPDGSKIAFIGGIMSDEGFVGGDIFLVNAVGASDARNLTPDLRASASALRWMAPDKLLFTEYVGGGGAVATLDTANNKTDLLVEGSDDLHDAGNFPNLAVSADTQTWLAVRSDWQHAPEVWLRTNAHQRTAEWQPLTHANTGLTPHWGKAESLTWASDQFSVQGWLLYPEHFDPAKHYPMVVSIHGGPAGTRGNGWPTTHFDMSAMAALGYFVFFPNPRGSYGQGEAFTRGNIQDFGYGDLRDVLAGVDTVLKHVPVDPERLGVTGWSYGGYMTMWTVTQTQRFHAAVAGAGIADWQSYYGQNSIDQWMVPYFGDTVYNKPAVYARSSPIDFIKHVKTPTLVLVGENDAECPSPQSFEFWHALNALDVPTHLIVYPGEGHAFHEDRDQLDRMQRTAAWFEQFLGSR